MQKLTKSLVFAAFSMAITVCNAQGLAGSMLVIGNGRLSFSKPTETNSFIQKSESFNAGLNGSLGYFFSEKDAIGPILSFGYSRLESVTSGIAGTTTNKTRSSDLGLGAFWQRFSPLGSSGDLFWTLKSSLIGSFGKDRFESFTSSPTNPSASSLENSQLSFEGRFSPGLAYFIHRRFGLNLSFGALAFGNADPGFISTGNGIVINDLRRVSVSLDASLSSLGLGGFFIFNRTKE